MYRITWYVAGFLSEYVTDEWREASLKVQDLINQNHTVSIRIV